MFFPFPLVCVSDTVVPTFCLLRVRVCEDDGVQAEDVVREKQLVGHHDVYSVEVSITVFRRLHGRWTLLRFVIKCG